VKDADRPGRPQGQSAEALETGELRRQIQLLEEETAPLRRRLQGAPRQVRAIEEWLLGTERQLAQALSRNEPPAGVLREMRERLLTLKEEAERLLAPSPWDIGRPQAAFLALAEVGAIKGRVLDVGCGTGEHVLMAAGLGLEATGVDLAAASIDAAEGKARDRGLTARLLVWNALQLASLGEQFDTVLDCGLFHLLDDDDRRVLVDNLRAVIPPGGRYLMLCFSDRQPGHVGPRRVTRDEIRASFDDGWQVDSIEPAEIEITTGPNGILAWLATIIRT